MIVSCYFAALAIWSAGCAAGDTDADLESPVPDEQRADAGEAPQQEVEPGDAASSADVTADTQSDAAATDASSDAHPTKDAHAMMDSAVDASVDAAAPDSAIDSAPDAALDAHAKIDSAAEAGPLNACGVCDRVWVCNGFAAQWSSVGGRCVNDANGTGLRCNHILDGMSANNVGSWTGDDQHLTLVFNSFGGTHTIACVP